MGRRFNSFVLRGEGNEGEVQLPPPVKGGKASQQVVFDLVKAIHESEARMHTDAKPAHKFEVRSILVLRHEYTNFGHS